MLDRIQKSFCKMSVENNIWTTSELSDMLNVDFEEVEQALRYEVEERTFSDKGRTKRENKWINDRIKDFYDQGFTAKEAAMQLSLNPGAFKERCTKLGLNFQKRQLELRTKNLIRLVDKKKTVKEISEELELNEHTLRQHAKKEGFKSEKGKFVKIEEIN